MGQVKIKNHILFHSGMLPCSATLNVFALIENGNYQSNGKEITNLNVYCFKGD